MSRPRLLDLFCGAGGCSRGYHDAGFDVVGVDIRPMPRYPYEFHQADALEYLREHGHEFDAIHASPPCQAYCALKSMPNAKEHPDLVGVTREALRESGRLYVIENVPGAPLVDPVMLCGTMFGLQTDCGAQLRRHRLFETNWLLLCGLVCQHRGRREARTICVNGTGSPLSERTISVHGTHARDGYLTKNRVITVTGHTPVSPRTISVVGHSAPRMHRTVTVTGSTPQSNTVRNENRETFSIEQARKAMGIDWMPMRYLSQAIPPAYTRFIGAQLMKHLEASR